MHWLAEKQQLSILPLKKTTFLFASTSRILFSLRKWDLHMTQAEHVTLSTVGATSISEAVLCFVFLQILSSLRKPTNAF